MVKLTNKPNHFNIIKSEHLSLALLRLLQREPGYCSNELVILDWFQHLGLISTTDKLRKCASDLEVIGLIQINTIETLQVFKLTKGGVEVALGHKTAEGVLRPSPDCPY